MTALDYILEGLEAELALERELGVRLVECDRTLLAPLQDARGSARSVTEAPQPQSQPQSQPQPQPQSLHQPSPPPFTSTSLYPFVFLHDRPLSQGGIEMMAKIITAMGATAETAPILFEPPIPKAKVYVVLGGLALRKFQPALKGVPGMWLETAKGAPVLVTYSPEYILRFKEVTPAVKKIKQDMWQSLKSVLQRLKN